MTLAVRRLPVQVRIDLTHFSPADDLLACTVQTGDGATETVYLSDEHWMRHSGHEANWRIAPARMPKACADKLHDARIAGIRRLEASIDPQDGVTAGTVRQIRALTRSEGEPAVFVQTRPQLGEEMKVHVTFIGCSCRHLARSLMTTGCVQVTLGTIRSITGTTRQQLEMG